MVSDDELDRMTVAERIQLAQRLTRLGTWRTSSPTLRRRRRRFVVLMTAASVALIPWIVILGYTLPHRYVAGHWTLTWVGFDVALLVGLALTAWYAWRGRLAVIASAIATGTLLICDAWFDVLTSDNTHDAVIALLSALILEIPLAFLLFRGARRIMHLVVLQAYGRIEPRQRLHDAVADLDDLTVRAESAPGQRQESTAEQNDPHG